MKKQGAFERALQMAQQVINPAMDNLRLWAEAFGFGQPEKLPPSVMAGGITPTPTPWERKTKEGTQVWWGDSDKNPFVTKTPTPTTRPSPKVTPIPNDYEKLTMGTADKYNIPREIMFGIAQGEGGYRNRFNLGATDTNPTAAPQLDDLTAATLAAKLFSGQSKNSGTHYLPAYELRASPEAMLKKIQDLEYVGDPKTWKQRSIEQGRASGTRGAGEDYDSWFDYIVSLTSWDKWHGKY